MTRILLTLAAWLAVAASAFAAAPGVTITGPDNQYWGYDAAHALFTTGSGGGGGSSTTVPDVSTTGTIAANTVGSAFSVAVNDRGTVRFVVSGLTASSATLQAQYSADGGTTWEPIAALRPPLAYSTTITADGQYEVKSAGTTGVRLIVTAAGSAGTINVTALATQLQGLVGVVGPLPPGTNAIGSVSVSNLPATQATSVASGANVTEGTPADAAYVGSGNATVVSGLKGLYAALIAPTPAGSAVIGKVGVDQTTPGSTNAVAAYGSDGTTQRQVLTTTTGALEPVTAASSTKIVTTVTSLAANTSTTIQPATAGAIAEEIQCDGAAAVAVDRLGGTLTSAAGAGAAAPIIIPSGSYPLYTLPVATRTAITAYTGTAQTCRATAYLR